MNRSSLSFLEISLLEPHPALIKGESNHEILTLIHSPSRRLHHSSNSTRAIELGRLLLKMFPTLRSQAVIARLAIVFRLGPIRTRPSPAAEPLQGIQ